MLGLRCTSSPRLRKSMYAKALVFACLTLVLCMPGCIFSPKKGGGGVIRPSYPVLSQPLTVLEALSISYVNRDTAGVRLVYDQEYTGSSTDESNPGGPLKIDFKWTDEFNHVLALYRSPDVLQVNFQLPPGLKRFTDDNDPPGWATITITQPVTIEILGPNGTESVATKGETLEFKFKPTTPAPSSPSDTTWQIIRWTEIYIGSGSV